jgi:galactokinase/mevalonate kinase-like predicted kinase
MGNLPVDRPGVLVVSGDVLPIFDYSKADFSQHGVTGVAYLDGPEEARRHGVYMIAGNAASFGVYPVENFLQKPDAGSGLHLIDTGIMFIDAETAYKMRKLPVSGDIYDEFPKMLLSGFAPFNVYVAEKDCVFFHVGSSREVLSKLGDGSKYVYNAHCKLNLAGDNVVTNVPTGRFKSLTLGPGECFTCIPYGRRGWLDLKYRIDDNFKTDGLWERHNLGAIMPKVDYARLLAMSALKETVVTAPVRIDLAGGWRDTPPVCYDLGGAVVNVAVKLNGEMPIKVTVRERRDRFVRIVSRDLGKRRVVKSQAELDSRHHPSDWCALVKNALAVTGYQYGAKGLDIEISANLPKGSGMGTSSILGAATIAALLGSVDVAKLGELTLRLEKEMSTGGGWQDQFGGMLAGAKLLESNPGKVQQIRIDSLPCEWLSALLKERGLLYFTGQKRMARNILRKVLAFYADNPHGFATILVDSLKNDARRCARAIREHDEKTLAESISNYWRDKKLLDPDSTNSRIEALVELSKPYASAVTLAGAGGGGFMFILAKSRRDADRIRALFKANAPSSASRFYDFEICASGISITKK